MKLNLKAIIPALALSMLAGTALADETALTIYSSAQPGAISPDLYRPVPGGGNFGYSRYNQIPGYAIIKQQRDLEIKAGVSNISFTGVAALLDPTTVIFESITDPKGTSVLEQDYRFDLLSMEKMLQRYIDKEIIWGGESVKLLSVSAGGMLIQGDSGSIQFVQGYNGVKFPSMAKGLILKPTLNWMIESNYGGEQETRISYETKGITWWADYNLIYNDGKDANHGTMDLGAWVSILNQSGGTYEDASLKLVAGDVNRAQSNNRNVYLASRMVEDMAMKSAPGFAQKSFFEYHLYTLGRKTTIPDRSTKQIELFDAAKQVPVEKKLLYDGSKMYMNYGGIQNGKDFGVSSNAKVEVFLSFENSKENGLGMPLPRGRIRVSKLDEGDGSFEFIGEDTIDHTPKDETVLIKLGNAFDVVGERRQTSFTKGKNWIVESFEIKLRNHKDQSVDVNIQEHLYRWSNAKVIKISHAHEMLDARTMHIPVTIEKDGEVVVTYTVRYDW